MKQVKTLLLVTATTLLTACSLGPVKTPEVAQYFLQAPPVKQEVVTHEHHSILLATIESAPGYQTNAMHYVITPYQLQSFSTHAWVSPPAKLWQPILENAIEQSGLGVVVHVPTPAQTQYRLNVRLDRFEQNFQQPQSVFVMQASVVLQGVKTGRVIAQHTFTVTVPAQTNTPYAGVLAANQAVGEMNQKIVNYLIRTIA